MGKQWTVTDFNFLGSKIIVDGEGQGRLAQCSPWGHNELDMTQWLSNNNIITKFSKIKEQVFGTKPTEFRFSVIGMTVLPSTEKEEIGHLRVKDSLWPRVEMTQETKCGWEPVWFLRPFRKVPKLGGPFSYYGFMWGQIFFQYFNQNILQQVWESSCLLWRQTHSKRS